MSSPGGIATTGSKRRSATPWPCSTCGAAGVRNLGTRGHCVGHLAELYRRFDSSVWSAAGGGLGLPLGPTDGDGYAQLHCACCGATWDGPAFMRCAWCIEAGERMIKWQREILLRCPIGHEYPADELGLNDLDYRVWCHTRGLPLGNRAQVLRVWQRRLRNAVETGLITRDEAEAAWARARESTRGHQRAVAA
jgi:hypothetical protein